MEDRIPFSRRFLSVAVENIAVILSTLPVAGLTEFLSLRCSSVYDITLQHSL